MKAGYLFSNFKSSLYPPIKAFYFSSHIFTTRRHRRLARDKLACLRAGLETVAKPVIREVNRNGLCRNGIDSKGRRCAR